MNGNKATLWREGRKDLFASLEPQSPSPVVVHSQWSVPADPRSGEALVARKGSWLICDLERRWGQKRIRRLGGALWSERDQGRHETWRGFEIKNNNKGRHETMWSERDQGWHEAWSSFGVKKWLRLTQDLEKLWGQKVIKVDTRLGEALGSKSD